MELQHTTGTLQFSDLPIIMGILNVTPDSFSDGGEHFNLDDAVNRAVDMIDEGATIVDIGGESTRPGAKPVSVNEECDRVIPVIERLQQEHPEILISIDTSKAQVARQAVQAGASLINDVSGGLWDPDMFATVRDTQAGYICMHALDRPELMQQNPTYRNVVQEVLQFLLERKKKLLEIGVATERLAFDAGIGFGKTLEHNIDLIRAGGLDGFIDLNRPMLWGLSRKSFIDKLLRRAVTDRLPGGLAAHASLLRSSQPQIWRVHDVQSTADYLAMHHALR